MLIKSLYIIILLFISCSTANAEQAKTLDTMIISAPLQKKMAETIHPVNILLGDDLTFKQGTTIGDTLKQELGIHSSSFGASVGQPVIRGQLGTRVQVLQNGVSSLDVAGVSPDHANSTEGQFAEQIEVLRGPASLLYGSGAIGGVVNVISHRIPLFVPKISSYTFEQRYNSVSDEWISALKHEGGADKVAWYVDGFIRDSDNYDVPSEAIKSGSVFNTDAQSWSATAGGSWVDDWGMLGVSINRLDNNYGVPPVDELVRIDLQQTRYDVNTEFYEPFSWVEILKIRLAYNDYQHAELEDGITVGTLFGNKGLEGRVEIVHDNLAFIDRGAIGFQAQQQNFSATGEEAFVPPSTLHNYGIFAVENMRIGDITYEAGLRVEYQQIEAQGYKSTRHLPLNASISALWSAADDTQVSLALTYAQRAPSIQELFANGAHFATQSFEVGDKSLKLETSYNLEVGFKADLDGLSTELNLFHNRSNDYIIQRRTGETFNLDSEQMDSSCVNHCLPVYTAIQQDASFYGFESQISFPLRHSNSHTLEGSLFADYVRGKLEAGGNVPRMPPLRYGIQLDLVEYDGVSASLRLTRVEKQRKTSEYETPTKSYSLLGANINYNWRLSKDIKALFFVKGNNLLNEIVRNSTSFLKDVAPEPGRGAELGFKIAF
ncbi:MAG: iron complex outermembrane receptor protein [Cycloclasticus sp.]|jgi:iron complex outermembrane receptor protein